MEIVDSTLVWVRFSELPLELFDEESSICYGKHVGKTMKIDKITLQADRGKYARVCMEVDLSEPLVPFISILGCLQRVEYEGPFVICFDCEKYSHKPKNCTATSKQPTKLNPSESKIPDEQEGLEKLYGPWIFSARRRMRTVVNEAGQQVQTTSMRRRRKTLTLIRKLRMRGAHGKLRANKKVKDNPRGVRGPSGLKRIRATWRVVEWVNPDMPFWRI